MFFSGVKVTDRVREALTRASQDAMASQHTTIGPEHLLLALLRDEHGGAAKVVAALGVDVQHVRGVIASALAQQPLAIGGGLTPEANNGVMAAVAEAQRLGHRFAGTEHLLLGLATGPSYLASLLDGVGLSAEQIRPAAQDLWARESLPLDQPDLP